MSNQTETGGIAADRLRSLIERIERLEEGKGGYQLRYSRHFCRSQRHRF